MIRIISDHSPLPTTDAPTVQDLLTVYTRDYLASQALNTRYKKGVLFRRYIREFGHLPLTAITPAWLRAWRDQLAACYKPGTVRVYMDALSAALTVAVEELDLLDTHPMKKVRKSPDSPPRVRFLSDDERARLLVARKQSRNPALYPLVLLAIATGARKMELCALRREHVDVAQGLIRLPQSKNKVRRVVPVVDIALDALRQWVAAHQGQTPYLFPRRDGKPMRIDPAWWCALERAGIENFHFHDLRHTCGSYLAMSGASLREIAEVLGHKTVQMSMKYTHLTLPHTTGVVARMAAQFLTTTHPEGA